MSNILIIKHGSLGDIVQISGVLKDIRETHNDKKIFILTTLPYVELLSKCPYLNGVLIDKRLPRWNVFYLYKLKKMIAKYKVIVLFLFIFLQTSAFSQGLEKVYFAGGCFWCMEESFEKKEGVLEVISGYSGGTTTNPTYEEVTYGNTGHFEVAKIIYDENVINYKKLLSLKLFIGFQKMAKYRK